MQTRQMRLNSSRGIRTLLQRVVLIAVVAASLLLGRHASAQGTSGTLPDPVSSGDLNKYLDRYLDLTGEQWTQIDTFHEQYKEEFKHLRETEIEQFLVEMRTMQGKMPKKAELKSFLDKMDRMQARIRSLDAKLFDQVQGVLAESQVSIMPRVRKARERDTYKGGMMSAFGGGANVDLVDSFYASEASPEEMKATESLMADYESRLTSMLKRQFDETANSIVVMFEAIEKSGIDVDSFSDPANIDPEKMQQMMEVMQNAMAEASKKSLEISADIAAMHHVTRGSVSVHLQPKTAKKFKDEFYRRAYSRIAQRRRRRRTAV